MSPPKEEDLNVLIAEELAQDVLGAVRAVAKALLAEREHGISAVLFYGSCLRSEADLTGLIDLYVIVDDFRDFYRHPMARLGNWLVPPNVYYLETEHEGERLRAKYAVISRRQLAKQTGIRSPHASLWGRLCQPCRLVYVRDVHVKKDVERRVADAVLTFYGAAKPLLGARFSPRDLWLGGLRQCYRTEFRAERTDRPEALYEPFAERYQAITRALVASDQTVKREGDGVFVREPSAAESYSARVCWILRRLTGRCLQVLRLVKGAFTFSNGLSYILYKIEKHSGARVEPTDWQRRHPLLAAPGLAWRLYRRGGFR